MFLRNFWWDPVVFIIEILNSGTVKVKTPVGDAATYISVVATVDNFESKIIALLGHPTFKYLFVEYQ